MFVDTSFLLSSGQLLHHIKPCPGSYLFFICFFYYFIRLLRLTQECITYTTVDAIAVGGESRPVHVRLEEGWHELGLNSEAILSLGSWKTGRMYKYKQHCIKQRRSSKSISTSDETGRKKWKEGSWGLNWVKEGLRLNYLTTSVSKTSDLPHSAHCTDAGQPVPVGI